MVAVLQYKHYLQDLPSSKVYLEMMTSNTATEKNYFLTHGFQATNKHRKNKCFELRIPYFL